MDFVVSQSSYHYIVISLHNMAFGKSQWLYLFKLCKSSYLSLCMRKLTICIYDTKGADQLRGNREADHRLCFRYTDSTIALLILLKSEISSFQSSSVLVQADLCRAWSVTQVVGFLMQRLKV